MRRTQGGFLLLVLLVLVAIVLVGTLMWLSSNLAQQKGKRRPAPPVTNTPISAPLPTTTPPMRSNIPQSVTRNVPLSPPPSAAPAPSAPVLMVYQPLLPGVIMKQYPPPIARYNDGSQYYIVENPQGEPELVPVDPQQPAPIQEGKVILKDADASVFKAGNATILKGTATVLNVGPYDVTDFQVCIRLNNVLHVLVPAASHAPRMVSAASRHLKPSTASVVPFRVTLPYTLVMEQTSASFYLEAQIDGPPGLVRDEVESVRITYR
ncbi:hypothetical protein HRbin16_01224 [bacterium HR16]|nr:hypothetical protein HRbin16_01224 [bacterium HR16]